MQSSAPQPADGGRFKDVERILKVKHLENGDWSPRTYRQDGCRQGDACKFCHECTAEDPLAFISLSLAGVSSRSEDLKASAATREAATDATLDVKSAP